jgi:hypothetical protein
MKTYKKILIGGLGALTPIIMNLLVIDLEVIFLNVTLFAVFGYLIRVNILFYLGGMTAFLHKDETSPVKIFELGIVAPALITALINAGQIDVQKVNLATENKEIGAIQIISSAYAQTAQESDSSQIKVKTFYIPKETIFEQLLRGALGRVTNKTYYVSVGTYEKLEDAIKQVKKTKEKTKNFKPDIYKVKKVYVVVIGAYLTQSDAEDLKEKATGSNYFKEAFIQNLKE